MSMLYSSIEVNFNHRYLCSAIDILFILQLKSSLAVDFFGLLFNKGNSSHRYIYSTIQVNFNHWYLF